MRDAPPSLEEAEDFVPVPPRAERLEDREGPLEVRGTTRIRRDSAEVPMDLPDLPQEPELFREREASIIEFGGVRDVPLAPVSLPDVVVQDRHRAVIAELSAQAQGVRIVREGAVDILLLPPKDP